MPLGFDGIVQQVSIAQRMPERDGTADAKGMSHIGSQASAALGSTYNVVVLSSKQVVLVRMPGMLMQGVLEIAVVAQQWQKAVLVAQMTVLFKAGC